MYFYQMKKSYKLNCNTDYKLVVLAISSHCKAYKLCWMLNKTLGLNFEMTQDHKINKDLLFSRYTSKNSGARFDLVSNRSKKGYMIPSNKSINYFLITKKDTWVYEKDSLLAGLRTINDILLVFEIDLKKEQNSDRFIVL